MRYRQITVICDELASQPEAFAYTPDELNGTHVVLPLNPSQIDEAAMEAMAQELSLIRWEVMVEAERDYFRRRARAALAALLAHYAEVSRG